MRELEKSKKKSIVAVLLRVIVSYVDQSGGHGFEVTKLSFR